MDKKRRSATKIAHELIELTRDGKADRLALKLVIAANHGFQDVVTELVDTFVGAAKLRRDSLGVAEPFRLRLQHAGRSVPFGTLDPAVGAAARAIAASMREDPDDRRRQLALACGHGTVHDRYRVLAQCVEWTTDLIGTDPSAYPPVLACQPPARSLPSGR